MGYPQVLEVLARLHVDPRFRAAYLRDAPAALGALALAPEERERLACIRSVDVERAGRLMDHHRVARVREHLPWVDPVLRPELASVLGGFLADVLPELLNREEAVSFCRYLERTVPACLPAYVPELARCERLRIALAWGLEPLEGASRVESFAWPVKELLEALARPGWPEPAPRPTRVTFLKVPGLPAVLVQ
ncbi:hypothetical protein NR798_35295 [Archangium gephyra]|uniref:hypothetical protein n=1 Tax=Archangium gephyra TaxID=48 RepID=UPI0035D46486